MWVRKLAPIEYDQFGASNAVKKGPRQTIHDSLLMYKNGIEDGYSAFKIIDQGYT
jgi:hypothetical protein